MAVSGCDLQCVDSRWQVRRGKGARATNRSAHMFSKSSGLFVLERVYHSDPIVNKCLFLVCLCYCHLLSACSPQEKRWEKNNATPRRKGESAKKEEERGKVKGEKGSVLPFLCGAAFLPSFLEGGAAWGGDAVPSFFGVALLSLLGWCCFFFWVVLLFPFFWVVLHSLPVAPFGVTA